MDKRLDYSGKQIGKYYLISKLGNGNFGVVYRVKDKVLKCEKAIKILTINEPEEALKAFNEAEIPYKCKHKNIVPVNDGNLVLFNGETLFIIDMDYIAGGSLEGLIKKKFVSVSSCLDIFINVLYGLEYAHQKGIIHRDIKPANILINNGIPLISDFGLSTILNSSIDPWCWYRTHAAPECFSDNAIATIETDIFALGSTMFRILNQIEEWNEMVDRIPSSMDLIKKGILLDTITYKSYIPMQIKRIIRKACNPKPQSRYKSAAQMRNDLLKLKSNYEWIELSDERWLGRKQNEKREICINRSKNSIEFTVKKNDRRLNNECKLFNDEKSAKEHMYEYICKSTLL